MLRQKGRGIGWLSHEESGRMAQFPMFPQAN